jgi:hypothetical protein
MAKAKKEGCKPKSRKKALKQKNRISQNYAVIKSLIQNESTND